MFFINIKIPYFFPFPLICDNYQKIVFFSYLIQYHTIHCTITDLCSVIYILFIQEYWANIFAFFRKNKEYFEDANKEVL